MRLVRLLTTGKSLVGVKDLEGRYNVTNQRLLPKFGSTKNPFQPASKRTPELPTAAPAPVPAEPAAGPAAPEGAPSAAAPAPAVVRQASPPPARSRLGAWFGRWTRWFGGSRQRPQPAIPQFKAPVQTELRLDAIKVVRNDLSDSDLEVVATKPSPARVEAVAAAKPAMKPAMKPAVRPARPAAGWGRGSTRLFSAGKTLS